MQNREKIDSVVTSEFDFKSIKSQKYSFSLEQKHDDELYKSFMNMSLQESSGS